ncbi:nonstructural protein [Blackfly microvirus SF02]|uniref:Nonstructural protein n=1 Tax=Blackfly microvirus SF02 TaxID=2576452 RepID=A0A4P8PK31_9VIRU|nr:nonstructural protein [Blackfly microvirus SF02]
MILYVCAVFDSATQAYGRPIFVNAPGQAMRGFGDEVANPAKETDLAKHPSDFELFQLATFDDATGRFHTPPDPVLLVRGKDCAPSKE